ncbi:hypothetical protein E2C01_038650 [Portunus trituberculatus]|uniref:Uncharacterized protein n=1 Tax=Portunus trituberculatus TaxID=210409 RepID=A0A5B7FJ34_PORTR|nr:hypothetical protein [Portunus trituberculatus]
MNEAKLDILTLRGLTVLVSRAAVTHKGRQSLCSIVTRRGGLPGDLLDACVTLTPLPVVLFKPAFHLFLLIACHQYVSDLHFRGAVLSPAEGHACTGRHGASLLCLL